MKKKSVLMVACLLMVSLIFAGCGFQPLSAMPNRDAQVIGNGGLSVVKGEYVYYVDSFVEASTVGRHDNTYNKVDTACIYRTKMVDGELVYNEDGVLQNVELVVPKIVGFENTNLFIFDDYIYYGTPNTQNDKDAELRNDLIDFCRAKLDGSNVQIIYTTTAYEDDAVHSFYKVGSSVYLVVFDGSDIIRVEIGSHIKNPQVLVSDVDLAMLPEVSTYNYATDVQVSGTLGYAYYTRALNDEDGFLSTEGKGNVLGRVNIATKEIEEVIDGQSTHELLSVQEAYVYEYITINGNKCIYATDFDDTIQVTTTSAYTDIVVLSNTNNQNRGIVATFQGSTLWIKDGTNVKESSEELLDSSITVKYVDDSYIYYVDGTKIYRISLDDFTKELVVDDATMNNEYLDFSQAGYIYYFATYTGDNSSDSAQYLNRVNLSDKIEPEENSDETDLGYAIELVGVLDEKHIKTEADAE